MKPGRRKLVLGLLAFNGLTAIVGGMALVAGINTPPIEWLDGTVFADYVVPGIILTFIVGGSAAIAAWYIWWRQPAGSLLGVLAGSIMCCWVLGEMAVVQHYSWLQLLYLLTGGLLIGLDYTDAKDHFLQPH
ncbi:MAG TPA: hypothetical protein VFH39_01675 [Candidatus Saccharimonadales bacterium]|nr:hypothetical protein [Candidatus Saccharimonadales bacterium]